MESLKAPVELTEVKHDYDEKIKRYQEIFLHFFQLMKADESFNYALLHDVSIWCFKGRLW